jgi:hypothetical protein
MAFLHTSLRWVTGAGGLMLLYIAFFLHEDEEGKLQNRIEEFWIKIDDLQKTSLSRNAAFLSGTSRIALMVLNRLFGSRTLSFQGISSCILFSFASTLLAIATLFLFWSFAFFDFALILTFIALLPMLVGALPALTRNRAFHAFSYISAISLAIITPLFFAPWDSTLIEIFLVLGAGISMDLAFIVFLRWLLKTIVVATNAAVMFGGLLLSLCAAILLNIPFYFFTQITLDKAYSPDSYCATVLHNCGPPPEVFHSSFLAANSLDFSIIFAINTLDAACVFLVFALMAAMLMHRFIWSFLERPVYATHRWNLLSNTKVLAVLGLTGLLYAVTPLLQQVIRAIKNLVT